MTTFFMNDRRRRTERIRHSRSDGIIKRSNITNANSNVNISDKPRKAYRWRFSDPKTHAQDDQYREGYEQIDWSK